MKRFGDTLEIVFSVPAPNRLTEHQLIHFLKLNGFARSDIIQTLDEKRSQFRVYLKRRGQAGRLRKAFADASIEGVLFEQRKLAYADWAEKWKEDYLIATLGKKHLVIPAWKKEEYRANRFPGRLPIVIDPQSAFGSGEHETTRLVVRLMESIRGKFESFLDIGTGTGILSIVAAACGASSVEGFDSDKPSVRCASFNYEINNSKKTPGHFRCAELAGFRSRAKFDLVCANINSRILEKHRERIVNAAKRGGKILLSGILRQTYDSFREAFDGKDLLCLKVMRGRRWVAVLYKKR